MKLVASILGSFLAYLVLSIGTLLMLTMIYDYSSMRTDIHFLLEKQAYIDNDIWRVSFYIHVFTSVVVLAAGLIQFSNYILTNYRGLHKWMGRIYVFGILFINFPTGLVLAINANGMLSGKIAFTILDILWFVFTYIAYRAIRKGKVQRHREFMIRSFALTFSAITLRTWKLIMMNTVDLDPATFYMINAWMGFVPNLLFAEWLIWRIRNQRSKSNMVR